MNTEEIFINSNNLPKPLHKREVYDLLEKIKQGDEKAKEKLITHNIRLVLYQVTGRFKNVDYDKKELVSIGNMGLIKAISTFDTSKKVEFATYATRCIDNEILMFLRKLKKLENVDSLDKTINYDTNGHELKIADTLSADIDILKEYTDNETYRVIREIIKDLPERDRTISVLHFGFHDGKTCTQKEIADMLSISQSYVSRIITKIVKKVGKQLEKKGLINLRTEEISKDKITSKKEGENKMARELQTIYEYFNSYTKEQVNAMLEKLSEDERALITLRYGEDLNNPVSGKLNKDETNKFYGSLIPKMKRLLANPNKEIKPRNKRTITTETVTDDPVKQPQSVAPVDKIKEVATTEQTLPETKETIKKQDAEPMSVNSSVKLITKEDYLKILELLRNPSFAKMTSVYSAKEAMIVSLKLGYIDGKCFSNSAISEFLGIEQQEIIDTTKKVLYKYKERINQVIDETIQIIAEESETTFAPHIKTMNK